MLRTIVRYAPSPTGIPHIGNIRTALFNYLFAKNQKGQFILRIEDTDQKRIVPESIEKIKESLTALGLIWDDLYEQSKRLSLYQKYLQILKEKSLAYQDQSAWRFKVKDQRPQSIKWVDLVHGPIEFKTDVIEDFVIVKSDGFPTYHFASTIDDHDSQITHVMRGDEWISSTPKHLLLYQAFGWQPPLFVHLPPILGHNKKKLSKREGAKSVLEYIKEGFLPEALTNFLAFLGWAPKDNRELFSLDELVKNFSLDRINKNSPIFNLEKLNWFNGQWIRRLDQKSYADRLIKYYPSYDRDVTKTVALLTQDRITNLADFAKIADFFYNPPTLKDIPPLQVSLKSISDITNTLEQNKSWSAPTIKELIDQTSKRNNEDRINLITTIRNIVAGRPVTPPLYESLEKLGKAETIHRLNNYLKKSK